MKKILCALIIIAALLSLASCNGDPNPTGTSGSTPPTSVNPTGTAEIEGTTLKYAAGLADENGVYVVPDGITFICESAFANDESLVEVVLPASVEKIGSNAFYACTALEKITMTDNVKSIGAYAFYGCLSLESITIPKNVTRLYPNTFGYCQTLEEIIVPEGVTQIDAACFYGCTSAEKIVLPTTLESIGSGAFVGCMALTDLVGFENTKITYVPDSLFSTCQSLRKLVFPAGVEAIDAGACAYCTALTDIVIPDSVKNVGMMAFSFTPWYLENTDKYVIVGDGVLIKCNVNPNGLDVPGTLDLSGLGIKSIGNSCFMNGSLGDYGAAYGYGYCSNLKNVIIPEGVTNIGTFAFFGCMALENVTLPSTLETIGGSAFYGMETGTGRTQTKFNLADCKNLVSIGSEAFYGCAGITSDNMSIPESVTYVGSDAFTETDAYYDFIDSSAEKDGNAYAIFGDNVLLWTYVAKDSDTIEVPENVKYIAGSACAGWDSAVVYTDFENDNLSNAIKSKYRITYNIKNVVIPSGVEYIGEMAFLRLTALESVTVPDSVKTLDSAAFYRCGTVSQISLGSGLESIGSYAFGATAVEGITIPESVVNIGAGAFSECSHLKELVIPKTVKTLGGAVIDQYCVTVEKVYMSEEFRPMLFVIVDTLNPDIKIYYYNED